MSRGKGSVLVRIFTAPCIVERSRGVIGLVDERRDALVRLLAYGRSMGTRSPEVAVLERRSAGSWYATTNGKSSGQVRWHPYLASSSRATESGIT